MEITNKDFLKRLRDIEFTPDKYYHDETDCIKISEKYELALAPLQDLYNKTNYGDPDYNIIRDKFYNLQEEARLDAFGDIGDFKHIETVGGEGEGDHYHVVLHFPEVDKYVYAEASYASHYGVDNWDSNWTVVKPRQKTITVYE